MDDNYTQKINIGARILDSARGNLYLAMRFMDIALCALLTSRMKAGRWPGRMEM